MNSSFLCVIYIGLVFQVFAQDQFHSQLWHENLHKMNEETGGNSDRFHSHLWYENLQKMNEDKEQFDFHSWRKNLKKMDEESKKRKAYELAVYMASNGFVDQNSQRQMGEGDTKIYLLCAEKTKVSLDMISHIKGGDWKFDDPRAKAWVQCVLMENDLMTDQSVFRLDVAFKDFTDSEKKSLEANIDKCLPTKAMPPVDISWEFAKCFQTADPENSLF